MAVAEKIRERAAALRSSLLGSQEEAIHLRGELSALDVRERQAREEWVEKNPGEPMALQFLAKIDKRRDEIGKRLAEIDADAEVRARVLARDDAALEEERREQLTVDALAFRGAEREAWLEFGTALAALHAVWVETVVPATEALDGFRETAVPPVLGGDGAEQFRAAVAHFTVEPVPCDFLAAIQLAYEAGADPHGYGYRDESPARRLDDWSTLAEVIPDLRPTNRALLISRGERRYSHPYWSTGADIGTGRQG